MRVNVAIKPACTYTAEGGMASATDAFHRLKRLVLTCLLWEDSFYRAGSEIAVQIGELIPQVKPEQVAALAVEARDRMYLRHVPLFLVAGLSKIKGTGPLVRQTLEHVIQRADELGEFLAMYWGPAGHPEGKNEKHPLSAGVKKGLAGAFRKFDPYRLAKYNRDSQVKLRDVLFLVHAKPGKTEWVNDETGAVVSQAELWKKLADKRLEPPDTWEAALSAGEDKRETFERLLREGKLGGMAVLMNLRNMLESGVAEDLIRQRLRDGTNRVFPYRFVVAAKYAPRLEDAIGDGMLKAIEGLEPLPGKTGLLVDVSGSMDQCLGHSGFFGRRAGLEQTSRIDVAAGLAILLREKAESIEIATFSADVAIIPPRRAFGLRDAIVSSQSHASTMLRGALELLKRQPSWASLDRVIVITDEQSQDGISDAWVPKPYVINVAPERNGVSYRGGWIHVDGWSERVIDFIREIEEMGEAVGSASA